MTGLPTLASASSPQLTKIVMQLRDFGVVNRARRLAIVSDLTRVRLRSMKDLTVRQAGLLIEELDHLLKTADPIAGLADACARAAADDLHLHAAVDYSGRGA